jgi:cobalt/nickel transport system permease protein
VSGEVEAVRIRVILLIEAPSDIPALFEAYMIPVPRHIDVPNSPLARWDARWKLSALLIAGFGVALLDHLATSVVALTAWFLLLLMARLPRRWVRGRLGLFGFAALPFVLILPFTLDPFGPGWNLGPVHVSERGIVAGLSVFCRCLAIGCLALILLGTAPLHHTLAAAHKLKVPGLLVLLVGLAYRYAFLLGDESRRIRIALRTRGFRARANRHGYRTLGHITGAILVRGADRADRVTDAMRCRGFDGTFRTTITFRTTAADFISWLLVIVAIAVIIMCDVFF